VAVRRLPASAAGGSVCGLAAARCRPLSVVMGSPDRGLRCLVQPFPSHQRSPPDPSGSSYQSASGKSDSWRSRVLAASLRVSDWRDVALDSTSTTSGSAGSTCRSAVCRSASWRTGATGGSGAALVTGLSSQAEGTGGSGAGSDWWVGTEGDSLCPPAGSSNHLDARGRGRWRTRGAGCSGAALVGSDDAGVEEGDSVSASVSTGSASCASAYS
jgi:hypothetical protein